VEREVSDGKLVSFAMETWIPSGFESPNVVLVSFISVGFCIFKKTFPSRIDIVERRFGGDAAEARVFGGALSVRFGLSAHAHCAVRLRLRLVVDPRGRVVVHFLLGFSLSEGGIFFFEPPRGPLRRE
jgi:hypothetical protein